MHSKSEENFIWELGCVENFILNEVFELLKKNMIAGKYINNQFGNYKETIRVNDKVEKLLKWKPEKL